MFEFHEIMKPILRRCSRKDKVNALNAAGGFDHGYDDSTKYTG